MKKLIVFLLLVCNVLSASSQNETPSTITEKNEVVKLLTHYNLFMYKMTPEDKAKFMRYYIYSPLIYVYNDLDSLAKSDDVITLQEYDNKRISSPLIALLFQGSVNLETIKVGNVKYDKDRKYSYVDVEAEKDYSGRRLTYGNTPEGGSRITNVPVSFPSKTLHFVVAFEKANGVSKNFKIAAISLKGNEPKLPEIKK